jgi:hypothetical protein
MIDLLANSPPRLYLAEDSGVKWAIALGEACSWRTPAISTDAPSSPASNFDRQMRF